MVTYSPALHIKAKLLKTPNVTSCQPFRNREPNRKELAPSLEESNLRFNATVCGQESRVHKW